MVGPVRKDAGPKLWQDWGAGRRPGDGQPGGQAATTNRRQVDASMDGRLTRSPALQMSAPQSSESTFKRYVEVGRVVLISDGPCAGKLATIVEIIDHNRVRPGSPVLELGRCTYTSGHCRRSSTDP